MERLRQVRQGRTVQLAWLREESYNSKHPLRDCSGGNLHAVQIGNLPSQSCAALVCGRRRWGRGVGLRLTNLVVPGGVSKQTSTQPTRREYDTARFKCRDKYQSDKCRQGLRQSEASVATGPGTTNQSNPPTPTLAGVFHYPQPGGRMQHILPALIPLVEMARVDYTPATSGG